MFISFLADLSYCVLEKQHVHSVCWFLCLVVRAYNHKIIQHFSKEKSSFQLQRNDSSNLVC